MPSPAMLFTNADYSKAMSAFGDNEMESGYDDFFKSGERLSSFTGQGHTVCGSHIT